MVVERRCTNCRWYKTVRRCTRCVVMGGASAPLHARCRRRRASLRADVVEATRRGGALVEASRRLLGLAVELRLTNDGLSSFSRECGVDTARTRRAARTENTRLHPHSTTKAVHFCFHSKIEDVRLCARLKERDGARAARPGVVSAPRLLHKLTSSTDEQFAERQRVAPLKPLGRRAHTLALARRETALAPSAPRARRLPASSRVPPQCHIWCAGHVRRRQRGQLGTQAAICLKPIFAARTRSALPP